MEQALEAELDRLRVEAAQASAAQQLAEAAQSAPPPFPPRPAPPRPPSRCTVWHHVADLNLDAMPYTAS